MMAAVINIAMDGSSDNMVVQADGSGGGDADGADRSNGLKDEDGHSDAEECIDFIVLDSASSELRTEEGITFQLQPILTSAEATGGGGGGVDAPKRGKKRPRVTTVTSTSAVPAGRARVVGTVEPAELSCEWSDCPWSGTDFDDFAAHVSEHLDEMEAEGAQDGDGSRLSCLWQLCGFETVSAREMSRHVHFHSFHARIKRAGAAVVSAAGIQPCQLDERQRNLLPDLVEPFVCQWRGCRPPGEQPEEFTAAHRFYAHVAWHAEELRDSDWARKTKSTAEGRRSKVACQWRGCSFRAPEISKLREHLRTHSQERAIGCPTCGGLFANKFKFFDHCKRQDSSARFRCSYCNKRFALERLLRDHMRSHINHYKCPACDMTCPSPSALNTHFSYRHSEERPYACTVCGHRSKSLSDLLDHESTVHVQKTEQLLSCPEQDCDFTALAVRTIRQHVLKEHDFESKLYCCHLCPKRYQRGTYLTFHLKSVHQLKWPSGHARFRYRRDDDGMFRLQTVRFEAAELDMVEAGHGQPTATTTGEDNPDEPDAIAE